MTALERVGGPDVVIRIMTDFVNRAAADFIIGFLFQGKDLQRIVEHESELAVAHLGGTSGYSGRPLASVHKSLRINRGQFRRRIALLRTVLLEHHVDDAVVQQWLAHDASLEAVITDGTECTPGSG